MQEISNSYKELINNNYSLSPKVKIVLDNVEYLGNVVKTFPKISHSSNFIGSFPIKKVSFDIYNLNNDLDFENKEFEVYKGIVVNESIEWVKQGIFKATSDNITNNITTHVMTIDNAQDRTLLFDNKYESSLDWSNEQTHTGLEIVQEICARRNIVLKSLDFAWANYQFKQPNFAENTSDREVISRIAEIGGEIAFIDCNGELVIKKQIKTNDTISRKRYEKLSREKKIEINTVVLGNDGIDNDIVFPEEVDVERVEFRILDNPFVDLYKEEMIEQVASYIVGMSYTPFELSGFVDGYIYELNDVVTIVDKNGNSFDAVILDYSNSSRIKSTIKADTMTKSVTNYNIAGSAKKDMSNVKIQVNNIDKKITAVVDKQDEDHATLSEIVIENGSISQRVTDAEASLNDLGETITKVEGTFLEQTNKNFTMWFEKTGVQGTLDDLKKLVDNQNTTIDQLRAYIRYGVITDTESEFYGSPYAEFGKEDAQTKLRILKDRIQFLTGETETAYISNNALYINESTILTKQVIGQDGIGKWITEIDEEGNLNTYWGGTN